MGDADALCPFLVPVMADSLWMYPMPAYCRRPDARVKVPARETFLSVCASPGHIRCPEFLVSTEREPGPGA